MSFNTQSSDLKNVIFQVDKYAIMQTSTYSVDKKKLRQLTRQKNMTSKMIKKNK